MRSLADEIQNKVSYFLASTQDGGHVLQNNVVVPQSPLNTSINLLALVVFKSFNCIHYVYSHCRHSQKKRAIIKHQNLSPSILVLPPPFLLFSEIHLPKPSRNACIISKPESMADYSTSLMSKLNQNGEDAKNQQMHENVKGFVINDEFIPKRVKIRMPRKIDPISGQLSSPRAKDTKIRAFKANVYGMSVSIASCTGARKTMQDVAIATHQIIQVAGIPYEFKLWGVFDGHGEKGGHLASRYVGENVVDYLKINLVNYNKQGLTEQGINKALEQCCQMLDDNYHGLDGTTALIVLQIAYTLWVANVGDSRAIIVKKNGQTLQISEDAKPEISKFADKIKELGGWITCVDGVNRVNGNLAVARAIGDKKITSDGTTCCISHEPVVTRYSMKDLIGAYLLMASDGLFDVGSSDEIGYAIFEMDGKSETLENMSKRLVYTALKRGTQDNVTVLMSIL